ncbi:helix-turn-helix transcriptional regulator [Brevirhabdus sp.]|uniref:helix-turn-helix transcriptional regulator n=1 Tax=Brevirhabdus sp. TaxID=2004514 RepID=UPI004059AC5E
MQIESSTPDKLVSIAAVAAILDRSRASIYRDIAQRVLPKPLKIGRSSRWRMSEVDAYIQRLSDNR